MGGIDDSSPVSRSSAQQLTELEHVESPHFGLEADLAHQLGAARNGVLGEVAVERLAILPRQRGALVPRGTRATPSHTCRPGGPRLDHQLRKLRRLLARHRCFERDAGVHALLGGDHLLLDADARCDRALVLERDGGGVLERDAGRVEHRHLVVRLAPAELARDHLADLAGDVVLGDQAFGEGDGDLAVLAALADVVDEDARALQDARVELLLALQVGAERREMRTGLDPRVVDEPAAGVRSR